jgi:hypothetical protein
MKDAAALIALAALLGLGVAVVPPVGEFPLCDDFDYAATAKDLADYGELRISDYPIATLATHAAWGALFVKLFGYSYATLRAASLTMALIASWSAYALARRLGLPRSASLLLGVTLLFNPILLSLSYTFYTNVTAVALMLASVRQLTKALQSGRPRDFAIAGVCGAIAYLARQTAGVPMLVFLATASVAMLVGRFAVKKFFSFASPALTIVGGYYAWLHLIWIQPYYMSAAKLDWSVLASAPAIASRLVEIVLFSSLHLAPLALGWAAGRMGFVVRSRAFWLTSVCTLAATAGLCALAGRGPAPFSGTLLADMALGVDRSLPPNDGSALHGPKVDAFGRSSSVFTLVAAIIAMTSAPILTFAVLHFIRKGLPRKIDGWLLSPTAQLSWSIIVSLGIVFLTSTQEPYLLSPLALLMVLVVRLGRPWPAISIAAAEMVVAGFAVFAFAGVDDMLARNAALWRAIDRLHASGVKPNEVNGGWEYAGVFRFNPVYRGVKAVSPLQLGKSDAARALHIARYHPASYFDRRRSYALALAPLEGHRIIDREPYKSFLRTGTVLTLKRTNGPVDSPSQ